MTFKQQRMIERLKRYFENEDEYNYKNVMCNILRDKHFEKLIIDSNFAPLEIPTF